MILLFAKYDEIYVKIEISLQYDFLEDELNIVIWAFDVLQKRRKFFYSYGIKNSRSMLS